MGETWLITLLEHEESRNSPTAQLFVLLCVVLELLQARSESNVRPESLARIPKSRHSEIGRLIPTKCTRD